MLKILVLDDVRSMRLSIKAILSPAHEVYLAARSDEAFKILEQEKIDLILLDYDLNEGSMTGLSFAQKVLKDRKFPIILLSSLNDIHIMRELFHIGVYDMIQKPFTQESLQFVISKIEAKINILKNQESQIETNPLIGKSEAFKKVIDLITQLKGEQVDIHITGPTGSGKEMIAKTLHSQEGDPHRPFIAINCAAIPENLFESILFGYERGSYTGAEQSKAGKIEEAHNGDLFLDEIACLPLSFQAKLLRVLQEKEVERIGAQKAKKINFRLISATNESLEDLVSKKLFREDLWMRLKQVCIQLPSLRERKEDIIPLAQFFVNKHVSLIPKQLSEDSKTFLSTLNFPGNIRELESLIRKVIPFSKGPYILPEHIEPFLSLNNRSNDSEVLKSKKIFDPENYFSIFLTKILIEKVEMGTSYEEIVNDFENFFFTEMIKKYKTRKELGEKLKISASTISKKFPKTE